MRTTLVALVLLAGCACPTYEGEGYLEIRGPGTARHTDPSVITGSCPGVPVGGEAPLSVGAILALPGGGRVTVAPPPPDPMMVTHDCSDPFPPQECGTVVATLECESRTPSDTGQLRDSDVTVTIDLADTGTRRRSGDGDYYRDFAGDVRMVWAGCEADIEADASLPE